MSSGLSRRGVLKGAAATTAATIVGWSAANSAFVTAAQAQAPGVTPVPALDGVLETYSPALGNFSKDFGELITGAPRAVLRPGSVQDVSKIITWARRNRLTVAMNGQSGRSPDLESHSSYGQALVPGGIAIDQRKFNKIHYISNGRAWVDSGVTIRQLTDAALAQGLTPVGTTDYLNLSIGGVISVGGIGGQVQKHGLFADTVEAIEIVTGTGDILRVSKTTRSDLFAAAVAGAGQFGIITKALIKLAPAHTNALVMTLFYEDMATFHADSEKIMVENRLTHQSGEIVRKPDDSGWRYKVEAAVYWTTTPPDQAAILADLRDTRADIQISEMSYTDWYFRLDGIEDWLKANGFWQAPKPWLSIVLPSSTIQQYIPHVVADLQPSDMGVGFSGLYPFYRSKLTHPFFMLPETSDERLWLFDLLRFPFPNDPNLQRMLDQNRRLYDLSKPMGGKRYTVGAIPGMTPAEWKAHFGGQYSRLLDLKRRYDPDRVLTPGQHFFA
ncbi:FAD linked oxidase domain protein [Alloactinosynnema sp. L-07]|uniref:FAD-binding protein n=1 Tax=Alloactinosynnema sp. L-07 TaxID=1653480 RepID=UPI00065F0759|nr:FAD-binding protein [Alloactinosynnema sp. L-07]CRK62123.1 FAD linked oxidase domain protein [Alloactinosynnema sp. L-07]